MMTPERSRLSDTGPQSWLEIELVSDALLERHRFLLLGLAVMAGGWIHDNGSSESGVALALCAGLQGGIISGCWLRSPFWLKCALMLVGSAVSFVHRELPMPGVNQGFLSSTAHWPTDGLAFQALALLFTISCLPPLVIVALFHFCTPALGGVLDFIETRLVQWRILPSRAGRGPAL